jgi:predicted secreted protein
VTTQVPVATIDNRPPLITGMSASPSTLEPAGTATLTAGASDPEGDELTFDWTAPEGWMLASDDAASIEVTAPDEYSATGVFELEVTDERDRSTTATLPLTTAANQGPRITSIGATPRPVERAGTVELHVSAADPNGDDLTYEWTAPGDWTLSDASAAEPTLTAPDAAGQSANIDLSVTDAQGLEATASVRVATVPNRRPVISDVSADSTTLTPEGTTRVSASADDPNGDSLTYSWSLDNADWSQSGSGDTVTLDAPDTPTSSVLVTVEVEDSQGAKRSPSTQVRTVSNKAPQITTVPTDFLTDAGRGHEYIYEAEATDPDDSNLTWSVSTQPPRPASRIRSLTTSAATITPKTKNPPGPRGKPRSTPVSSTAPATWMATTTSMS